MGRTVVTALTLLLLATSAFAQVGHAYRGYEPDPLRTDATIDVRGFWTYRFEHEKETVLAERIGALRVRSERPTDADIREHVLPVLFKATTHRHSWVRSSVVLALGKIGGKKVIPYLLARIENDPAPEVVRHALLGLGLTGLPEAVPHLVKALSGKVGKARCSAALALGLSGRAEARKPLLDVYRAAFKERDDEFLSCLAVALGAVGTPEDVPILAGPLKARDRSRLKVHTCQALGRIGGPKARDWLLRATADKKGGPSAAGILALGGFEGRRVEMTLLGTRGLKSGLIPTKCAALSSLARLGTRASEVAEAVEGPQRNIYAAMLGALAQGEFGRRDSIPWMLESLESRKLRKVREENATAIAMALGLLRETKATARIRELMTDKSWSADSRGYCAFALGCMGDHAQAATIREEMKSTGAHRDFRRSGCWALALIGGKEDIPFLMTLLEPGARPDRHVRGAAAIAIGLLGDRETLGELVTLAKESEHGSVRALAIAAIGWLADKDPVPRLPRMFHGLYDRQAADPIREAWSLL